MTKLEQQEFNFYKEKALGLQRKLNKLQKILFIHDKAIVKTILVEDVRKCFNLSKPSHDFDYETNTIFKIENEGLDNPENEELDYNFS